MQAFGHGFFLALGLILPLGVQNMFVLMNGASQPTLVGVAPVIITASLCDTLLILTAVMGVSIAILAYPQAASMLYFIGAIFCAWIGKTIWHVTNAEVLMSGLGTQTLRHRILFTASISLLNPHAIMDTVAVIGTGSMGYLGTDKMLYAGACILVSWLWFAFLSAAGAWLGMRESTASFMVWLNRISAIILWSSATYLTINGLRLWGFPLDIKF